MNRSHGRLKLLRTNLQQFLPIVFQTRFKKMDAIDNSFATYNPFQVLSQLEEETDTILELGDQFTKPEDVSGVGSGEDEVSGMQTCLERVLNPL
jgi:hypothetical protein